MELLPFEEQVEVRTVEIAETNSICIEKVSY